MNGHRGIRLLVDRSSHISNTPGEPQIVLVQEATPFPGSRLKSDVCCLYPIPLSPGPDQPNRKPVGKVCEDLHGSISRSIIDRYDFYSRDGVALRRNTLKRCRQIPLSVIDRHYDAEPPASFSTEARALGRMDCGTCLGQCNRRTRGFRSRTCCLQERHDNSLHNGRRDISSLVRELMNDATMTKTPQALRGKS